MSSPSQHPYKKILVLCLWLATWIFVVTDMPIQALWPSILALMSVLLLRKVIAGLLVGGSAGAVLLADGNPVAAFMAFFTEHLIPSLQNGWNISILIFTLLLGGFVALIEKGGGIQALVNRWLQSSRDLKQRVQWSAYGLGLVCFFDGLANSLLVGRSFTPVAREAGVSKEKLSYIVDSTSAAVACVAVVSTWIAYQLSMIDQGYQQAGIEGANAFGLFFQSIPLNFYCWFTLVLLALVIARNWNIGPMRYAEGSATASDIKPSLGRKSKSAGKIETAGSETERSGSARVTPPDDIYHINRDTGTTASDVGLVHRETLTPERGAWRALTPLAFLIGGLILGLYVDGTQGDIWPISLTKLATAFGAADAAKMLVSISALACIVAYLCNRGSLRKKDPGEVFMEGVLHLFTPCLILISVWILSSTIKGLGAAQVLSQLLDGNLPASLFPATVFLVGTLISFTTGSAWGTMGVLMPLALPVALLMNGGGVTTAVLIPGTIAAVFSGAVFGDHCSPLSDTTIVASIACDIEPLDHVRTQIPYALIAAGVALVVGFIPMGLGFPGWVSLVMGILVLWLLPKFFSQKIA